MTKVDIVEEIATARAGISDREAGALKESVLTEFGTFRICSKAARKGRNLRTGEPVTSESRRVVTFRASSILKATVNEGHGGAFSG